eukprot:GDKI01014229.1.p1 GENE.GDKI01014229.1~~GDKI01014229.1.p1  ORF type:complete len:331 (-),score=57.69 GDKI01014229.1:24-1016(-)
MLRNPLRYAAPLSRRLLPLSCRMCAHRATFSSSASETTTNTPAPSASSTTVSQQQQYSSSSTNASAFTAGAGAQQQKHTGKTTVSPEEIKFFNGLANTWWDKDGGFAGLHDFNQVRVPFIKRHAPPLPGGVIPDPLKPLKGLRVLDVGCGGGILTEALGKLGAKVTAVDMSEESVKAAEARRVSVLHKELADSIEYRCTEVGTVAEHEAGQYDIVVASEIIEHVEDVELFFKQISECVRPKGGSLIVTTLNKTPESYALAIVAAEYVLNIVPRGTHQWEKFIEPDRLQRLAKTHTLRHLETQGVAYVPFLRQFFCEPFCRVNYMSAFLKE